MAKHRIRRWFQFGILDLLLLTTVVAVGAVLWRPAQARGNRAPPWLVGGWQGEGVQLLLYPDGQYHWENPWRVPHAWRGPSKETADGNGWAVTPLAELADAFVLACGERRFIVRCEWASGAMDLLSEDGRVRSQLQQVVRLEGPILEGKPHGTWTCVLGNDAIPALTLEYRNAELTDVRSDDGTHDLDRLNSLRRVRGLPEFTQRDFPNEGMAGKNP